MSEPRDVIARALPEELRNQGFEIIPRRSGVHVRYGMPPSVPDAMLAALHEAGYEVGKKPTVRHEVFPFTDADVLPPDETP